MARNLSDSVELTLQRIDELFIDPTPAPLEGRFEERSGVEQLLDVIPDSTHPLTVHLALRHEAGEFAPAEVQRALSGYADARIAQSGRERERIRKLGQKELAFGVAFLAFCLVCGSAVSSLEFAPDWLRGFFAEGLVIVGWIALWHPVDMLFFERLPLLREERLLRRLAHATVHLRYTV